MSTGPSFPPGVWSITLHYLRDLKSQDELTYLWTTVRHVSRQCKTEVEDIFRTEHLPKTFLHVHKHTHAPHSTQDGNDQSAPSTNPQLRHDSVCRFDFDGINTTYPSRAVFSIHLTSIGPKAVKEMIKDIEAKTGPGRLGEADKSRPGGRVRLFENTVGLALAQIRGGLHDCTLPSLTIDRVKGAISLDWRDLFTRFFGEKRMIDRVLERAPMSDVLVAPSPPGANILDYDLDLAHRLSKVGPALQTLGQCDIENSQSNSIDTQARRERIHRLSDPVHMWIITTTDYTNSGSKMSIQHCRLRRRADLEGYLDDDGAVNEAKIRAEKDAEWGRIAAMREEHYHRVMDCDACRERNFQSEKPRKICSMGYSRIEGGDPLEHFDFDTFLQGGHSTLENFDFDSFLQDGHPMLGNQASCITCTASNVRCEFKLANFNQGMRPLIEGGPPERAYQERVMLLDQQGRQSIVF